MQFDRVGHENYGVDKQSRQIARLIEAGFVKQVLVSHDHVPYYCSNFTAKEKVAQNWTELDPDYTTVTTKLVESLRMIGASTADIRAILVANPQRVLAF